MNMRLISVAVALSIGVIGSACGENIHYRYNLAGYEAFDKKIIIIGSSEKLENKKFVIRDLLNGKIVDEGFIETEFPGDPYEIPFDYFQTLDVTRLKTPGKFRIEIEGIKKNAVFAIEPNYAPEVIETILEFFKVQRCGNSLPKAHSACHLYDPTNSDLDLSGGWHDAGDFLKFTRQIAYTTYLLLLSYNENRETNPQLFRDVDRNGRADVLDEAQIGLDYLKKCFPDDNTFVILVGDFEADHSQGFRMPEEDRLAQKNRPAIFGFKRDDLAKYAYTMALAASVMQKEAASGADVDRFRLLAERAYAKAKETGTGEWDKMCLAATELFRSTGKPEFLDEAKQFNQRLSSSDFGNYSDNTNLAHARLAPYFSPSLSKLRESVARFSQKSRKNPFGFAAPYQWGSLYVNLSAGSAGRLYHRISGVNAYADLSQEVRDYTLGKNPWGLSFISGVGSDYSRYLHHNIAMFLDANGRYVEAVSAMRGAVAEGPVYSNEWEKLFKRKAPTGKGTSGLLQPGRCVYHDHYNDYMTNEPCIYGAAEAILFFSLFQAPSIMEEAPAQSLIEPSRSSP